MKTQCPHCSQRYEIDDQYNGQIIECQKCGQEFVIEPRSPILATSPRESDANCIQNNVRFVKKDIAADAQKCCHCDSWVIPHSPVLQFFGGSTFVLAVYSVFSLVFYVCVMGIYKAMYPFQDHKFYGPEGGSEALKALENVYYGSLYEACSDSFFLWSAISIILLIICAILVKMARSKGIVCIGRKCKIWFVAMLLFTVCASSIIYQYLHSRQEYYAALENKALARIRYEIADKKLKKFQEDSIMIKQILSYIEIVNENYVSHTDRLEISHAFERLKALGANYGSLKIDQDLKTGEIINFNKISSAIRKNLLKKEEQLLEYALKTLEEERRCLLDVERIRRSSGLPEKLDFTAEFQ